MSQREFSRPPPPPHHRHRPPFDRNHQSADGGTGRFGRNSRDAPPQHPDKIVESIILDAGHKPSEDFAFLAHTILVEFERSKLAALNALEICIAEVPLKQDIYLRLLQELNGKNPEFVQEVLLSLEEAFDVAYKRSAFAKCALIMRFFAMCVSVGIVSLSSFLAVLECVKATLSATQQQQNEASVEKRETHAYLLLSCLPFVAKSLCRSSPDYVNDVLQLTAATVAATSGATIQPLLPLFEAWEPHFGVHRRLSTLQHAVEQLAAGAWQSSFALFPHFSAQVSSGTSGGGAEHDLRNSKIGSYAPTFAPLSPLFVFRTDACDEDGSCSAFERFCVLEGVQLSVEWFAINHKKGVETLATQFSSGEAAASLERLLVEALFALHFAAACGASSVTPAEVVVIAWTTALCRAKPHIAPHLGRVIRFFYAQAANVPRVFMWAFVAWFTGHLMCFDLRWNWIEWSEVALGTTLADSPGRVMLESTLDELRRFFVAERLKDVLPAALHSLIAAGGDAQRPAASLDPHEKLLRLKAPDSDFEPLLFGVATSDFSAEASAAACSAFVTSVFLVGAASPSHTLAVVSRYKTLLGRIAARCSQALLLNVLWEVHVNSVQFREFIVEKLLLFGVLTARGIFAWFFGKFSADQLIKLQNWKLLVGVMRAERLRIVQLSAEISALRRDDDPQIAPEEEADDAKLKALIDARTAACAAVVSALQEALEAARQLPATCAAFEKTRGWFVSLLNAELLFLNAA